MLSGPITTISSCNKESEIIPTEIHINAETDELDVGQTEQLFVEVLPEGAKAEFVWESSDDSKANVGPSGLVTAIGAGEVTIKVSVKGHADIFSEYLITVYPLPTSITITEGSSLEMVVGDEKQLHAVVNPDGAKQDVIWESDSFAVAVDSITGLVTAVDQTYTAPATITASVYKYKGIKATCAITVTQKIERINFNTCSWADISQACNNLEDGEWNDEQFLSRFTIDGNLETEEIEEQPANSFDDFIGQRRSLMINGYDHQARVIGCRQDFTDQTKKEPVVFTFQLMHLVSNNSGEQMYAKCSDSKDNANYWDTFIPQTLNSSDDVGVWADNRGRLIDEKRTVLTMISQSNDGIDFKEVYQTVNTGGQESWQPTSQKAKVFVLSLANLFCSQALTKYKEQGYYYKNEGRQYQYYVNEIGQGEILNEEGETIGYPCLIFNDMLGQPSYYWMRSPLIDTDTDFHQVRSSTGSISGDWANSKNCFVPCFCI